MSVRLEASSSEPRLGVLDSLASVGGFETSMFVQALLRGAEAKADDSWINSTILQSYTRLHTLSAVHDAKTCRLSHRI